MLVRVKSVQIATLYGVTLEEINSRSQEGHVVECRQAIWLYLRQQGETFQRIARYAGRNHSTIMWGIKKIKEKLEVYSCEKYKKLRAILAGDQGGVGTWPVF